jgi:hypothetical protein
VAHRHAHEGAAAHGRAKGTTSFHKVVQIEVKIIARNCGYYSTSQCLDTLYISVGQCVPLPTRGTVFGGRGVVSKNGTPGIPLVFQPMQSINYAPSVSADWSH